MFEPTLDIKEIFCYGDEMGIDHDYQFAFTCDAVTIDRIVNNLNLIQQKNIDNYGKGLWHEFSWWDSKSIETLKPYSKKGPHETYWYLWYDRQHRKAYYFSFDM